MAVSRAWREQAITLQTVRAGASSRSCMEVDTMFGLCDSLFRDWRLPLLHQAIPSLVNLVAAGVTLFLGFGPSKLNLFRSRPRSCLLHLL